MTTRQQAPRSGSDIVRTFVPSSPFARHCGIAVRELGDGEATLTMPFIPELVTIGDVVHGGRRLVSVAVDVHTAAGTHAVHALATYQLG